MDRSDGMQATDETRQPARSKILDAAEVLFARRGFSGVGLSEVAESVSLGKSTLFHHFSSKAQLYAAVIGRIAGRIEDRLMRSLADGGSPPARLERWLDELTDLLSANPTYARLLLRSLFEDDELTGDLPEERAANDHIRHILGAGARLLREGIDDGSFRPVHVEHTLQSLIGMTVFHFASGTFGDEVFGRSIFSPAEIRRRKREVARFARQGLARDPNAPRRIR
jgi:AcrR family transcriptional regulator